MFATCKELQMCTNHECLSLRQKLILCTIYHALYIYSTYIFCRNDFRKSDNHLYPFSSWTNMQIIFYDKIYFRPHSVLYCIALKLKPLNEPMDKIVACSLVLHHRKCRSELIVMANRTAVASTCATVRCGCRAFRYATVCTRRAHVNNRKYHDASVTLGSVKM